MRKKPKSKTLRKLTEDLVVRRNKSNCRNKKPVEITLTLDIGFEMLNKQKKLLLKQLEGHPESLLWGIVHMIDDIQDEAEKQGLWEFSVAGDDFKEE